MDTIQRMFISNDLMLTPAPNNRAMRLGSMERAALGLDLRFPLNPSSL